MTTDIPAHDTTHVNEDTTSDDIESDVVEQFLSGVKHEFHWYHKSQLNVTNIVNEC